MPGSVSVHQATRLERDSYRVLTRTAVSSLGKNILPENNEGTLIVQGGVAGSEEGPRVRGHLPPFLFYTYDATVSSKKGKQLP